MKYALSVLIGGYLSIFLFSRIERFIVPITAILLFSFSIYLFSKRIETIPNLGRKLVSLFALLLLSLMVLLLVYLSIVNDWFSIYYYPPIFAGLVLFRKVLKKLVNLSIKEPKSFGIVTKTLRGDDVRSKSEAKVADWLFTNDIEYEYERQIDLGGGNTILSDFYLIEDDIYIEYWGLSTANNSTGEKYRARKAEKIELYEKHNFKLMSIYPHHLYELDTYIPDQIAILTNKKRGFWAWLFGLFNNEKSENPQSPALFCTNCGTEVENKGDYCTGCGTQAT